MCCSHVSAGSEKERILHPQDRFCSQGAGSRPSLHCIGFCSVRSLGRGGFQILTAELGENNRLKNSFNRRW